MAAKPTRLIRKIAIQLHLVEESSTICSSWSRRPVRKLLDTLSYVGETRRPLETRLIEHKHSPNVGELSKFRTAEHSWNEDQLILFQIIKNFRDGFPNGLCYTLLFTPSFIGSQTVPCSSLVHSLSAACA